MSSRNTEQRGDPNKQSHQVELPTEQTSPSPQAEINRLR